MWIDDRDVLIDMELMMRQEMDNAATDAAVIMMIRRFSMVDRSHQVRQWDRYESDRDSWAMNWRRNWRRSLLRVWRKDWKKQRHRVNCMRNLLSSCRPVCPSYHRMRRWWVISSGRWHSVIQTVRSINRPINRYIHRYIMLIVDQLPRWKSRINKSSSSYSRTKRSIRNWEQITRRRCKSSLERWRRPRPASQKMIPSHHESDRIVRPSCPNKTHPVHIVDVITMTITSSR